MRFRTFAWLAAAIFVVGINTGIVLWLRDGRRSGAARDGGYERFQPRPGPETPVGVHPSRPGTAEAIAAATRRLCVAVVDSGGAPIPGAAVRVVGARPGEWLPFPEELLGEGTTGADGVVDLALPRLASLLFRTTAAGFAPAEVRTAAAEARVVLARESVLRVRVVDDASATPLEGVSVRLNRRIHRHPSLDSVPVGTGTTGADGNCAFSGLPAGLWSVKADAADRPAAWAYPDTAAGGETAIEIRLARGFNLRGRVVYQGSERQVTEGRVLTASHQVITRRFWVPGSRSAPIDAEGRFTLSGLSGPRDSSIQLRVETGGCIHFARGQRPVLDPATGEQVGEIQVQLPANNPDSSFSGSVTDEEGKPVEGALVLLGTDLPSAAVRWMRGEQWMDEGWTDESGRWRVLSEFGPGSSSQVLVLHRDYAPSLTEIPSRMRRRVFDLVLRKGARVVVQARGVSGPLVGATVVPQMRHPDPRVAWAAFGDVHGAMRAPPVTNSSGHAVLDHLGEGSWYLLVRSADGRQGARVLVDIPPASADLHVNIPVQTLQVVRGTVRARGRPRSPLGAILLPGESPGELIEVPVAGDGRFESPPLLIPPSCLVEGKVPVLKHAMPWPGEVIALLEFGVDAEIEIEPPAPPPERSQAR